MPKSSSTTQQKHLQTIFLNKRLEIIKAIQSIDLNILVLQAKSKIYYIPVVLSRSILWGVIATICFALIYTLAPLVLGVTHAVLKARGYNDDELEFQTSGILLDIRQHQVKFATEGIKLDYFLLAVSPPILSFILTILSLPLFGFFLHCIEFKLIKALCLDDVGYIIKNYNIINERHKPLYLQSIFWLKGREYKLFELAHAVNAKKIKSLFPVDDYKLFLEQMFNFLETKLPSDTANLIIKFLSVSDIKKVMPTEESLSRAAKFNGKKINDFAQDLYVTIDPQIEMEELHQAIDKEYCELEKTGMLTLYKAYRTKKSNFTNNVVPIENIDIEMQAPLVRARRVG